MEGVREGGERGGGEEEGTCVGVHATHLLDVAGAAPDDLVEGLRFFHDDSGIG